MANKIFLYPVFKRYGRFTSCWGSENLDNDYKFEEIEKFEAKFMKKIGKICDVKMLKTILLPLEKQ